MERTRTKIVATIGPASSDISTLTRMVRAGMNVARLNFSHGTHGEHLALIKHIRAAQKKVGVPVAILQDLQGPKMRLGVLPKEGIDLKKGQSVQLLAGDAPYETGGPIPIGYEFLYKDVRKGDRLFLDDGVIELAVVSIRKKVIHTKVVVGGEIFSHKGINAPDSTISAPSFTKKDHEGLIFGLEAGVDWVALSFVSSARVVDEVRSICKTKCRALGRPMPGIMAKIERRAGVESFEEILAAVDGVMIARGDLGIEIPYEEVPLVQKECVERAREVGKPVIVATHMLHSMEAHPRATRAEVSDVANAVIDHADAVMLSEETATGKYPYASVQTMRTVVAETEKSRFDDMMFYEAHTLDSAEESLAYSLNLMARRGQIDVIAAVAKTRIATWLNRFRPEVPILLACENDWEERKLLLRSGVIPVVMQGGDAHFAHRIRALIKKEKIATSSAKVAFITEGTQGAVHLTVH